MCSPAPHFWSVFTLLLLMCSVSDAACGAFRALRPHLLTPFVCLTQRFLLWVCLQQCIDVLSNAFVPNKLLVWCQVLWYRCWVSGVCVLCKPGSKARLHKLRLHIITGLSPSLPSA